MNVTETVRCQMLRYIVGRQITCPITGEVLDVSTCKYFVDKFGEPAYVLSAAAYDAAVSKASIVYALEAKGLYPMEES